MDSDKEDTVVQELDVYLSKTLSKNLYVFQYTSKPAKNPFDERNQCLSARVKPVQQKVELELGLDCESQNYDQGKGEQFVMNMKGDDSMKNFNSGYLERQLLTSKKAVSSTNRYAVGLLCKGEIHLTPLHAAIQLRPSFNYLDSADNVLSGKKDTTVEEDEEEPQAITVKFASTETEKSKAAKEKSFHFIQKRAATESWINTNFYPAWSGKSGLELSLLRCDQKEHDATDIQCSGADYVNTLVPNECNGTDESTTGTLKVKNTSHSDRIKSILLNAKVVKFDQLVDFLKPVDPALVLRLLQPIAILVQGCWVVKSELLYPKDSFSPVTKVPAEILSKARDFVIWRFAENPYFSRDDIPSSLKLPAEDWRTLLTDISEKQSNGQWKFRYEFDTEFTKSNPEVVQRQKLLWTQRNQLMNKIASGAASNSSNGPVTIKTEPTSPTSQTKRQRRKSIRDDSPQKALSVKQENESDQSSSGSVSDLVKSLSQIMKTHYCLSLSQAKNLLAPIYQRCSDKELEDAIVKVNGVFRLSIKWPQNASEEPIYGLIRVGDNLDKLREALLDLFSKTARMRITTFQKKVEDELGGKSSTAEANCKKILNEFCVLKAGFYYMKGSVLDT